MMGLCSDGVQRWEASAQPPLWGRMHASVQEMLPLRPHLVGAAVQTEERVVIWDSGK